MYNNKRSGIGKTHQDALTLSRSWKRSNSVEKLLNCFLFLHLNTKTETKTVKPNTNTNSNIRNLEHEPIRAKLYRTRSVYGINTEYRSTVHNLNEVYEHHPRVHSPPVPYYQKSRTILYHPITVNSQTSTWPHKLSSVITPTHKYISLEQTIIRKYMSKVHQAVNEHTSILSLATTLVKASEYNR